mmetsp:Transcript_42301/g.59218  ORF Transcript_42301/g.59218 Transcript_42301/m.59218 type:complete len:347 (+) Transcript_42301:1168-2208(+)
MADVQYPAKEPSRSDLKYLKPIENKFRGDDDPTYETWKHQIKGRLMQARVLYHIQIDDENDLVAPANEEEPAKKTREQRMINRIVIASFLTDCISGPPLKYITQDRYLSRPHSIIAVLDNHYLKDTEGELERIKKEINDFRKSESEDISAMVIRLLNLKNRFERAGGDMDEDMKCNILLKALVSRKWDQTTLDIKKRYKKKEIKYEDIIAEYKMTENHFKNRDAIRDQDAKIQRANAAHQQQQQNQNQNRRQQQQQQQSQNQYQNRGSRRDKYEKFRNISGWEEPPKGPRNCFHCGKPNHRTSDCCDGQKPRTQAGKDAEAAFDKYLKEKGEWNCKMHNKNIMVPV